MSISSAAAWRGARARPKPTVTAQHAATEASPELRNTLITSLPPEPQGPGQKTLEAVAATRTAEPSSTTNCALLTASVAVACVSQMELAQAEFPLPAPTMPRV